VTIIFKPEPGAKRWQPLQRRPEGAAGVAAAAAANVAAAAAAAAAPHPGGGLPPVEQNYTVILGSHRNSRLKFEKNGADCCLVADAPGARVSGRDFQPYWIDFGGGAITVGTGAVPGAGHSYTWVDPGPAIQGVQYVGLSCWDKHVSYRRIQARDGGWRGREGGFGRALGGGSGGLETKKEEVSRGGERALSHLSLSSC